MTIAFCDGLGVSGMCVLLPAPQAEVAIPEMLMTRMIFVCYRCLPPYILHHPLDGEYGVPEAVASVAIDRSLDQMGITNDPELTGEFITDLGNLISVWVADRDNHLLTKLNGSWHSTPPLLADLPPNYK